MSRIPELMDKSDSAMFLWWRQMATAGLAFHPDGDALGAVNVAGALMFTKDEAYEVDRIVHGPDGMHATHGDLIYLAASRATEEPGIAEAREHALNHWNGTDVQIGTYAEVEKVGGGYWIEAKVWVSAQ